MEPKPPPRGGATPPSKSYTPRPGGIGSMFAEHTPNATPHARARRRTDSFTKFSSTPRPPQSARRPAPKDTPPPRTGLAMNGGRATPLYAYSSHEEGEMEMMTPAPPGGVRLVRPLSAAQAQAVKQRQINALYNAPGQTTPRATSDAGAADDAVAEALKTKCKESCVLDYAMGADDAFGKEDSYEPGYYTRVHGEAAPPKDNKFTRTTTFAAQDGSSASALLRSLQDVIRFFADPNRDQNVKFVHLVEADSTHYSPYDLVIAHNHCPTEPHYIFSATGVVHCHPGKPTEVMNLSTWIREASLFSVLRRIAFFKTYLINKAFARWYRRIRKIMFHQTRAKLARQLLLTKRVFSPVLCAVHDLGFQIQCVPCISLTNRQERSVSVSEIDVNLTKFRDAQQSACTVAAKEISGFVEAIENTLFDCCEEVRQRADVPDAGRLEVVKQYVKSQMEEEGLAMVMTLNVTRPVVARHVREIASRHNTVISIPPQVPSMTIQGPQIACQNSKADLEDLLGHPVQVVRSKIKVRSMAQEKANIEARMSNIKRCMEEAECLERIIALAYHMISQHLFKFAVLQAESFRNAIRGGDEDTSILLNVKIRYEEPVTTFVPVEGSIQALFYENLKAISDIVRDTRLLGSKLCMYTEDVRKRLVCAIAPHTDFRFEYVVNDCASIVSTSFTKAATFVARFGTLHTHWKFLTADWKEVERCWADALSVTPDFFKQLLAQLAQIKTDLGGMYNKSFGPIQIAMLLAKDEVLPLLQDREGETGRVITRTWRKRVSTLLDDVADAKRTISDTSLKLEKFAALSRAIRELEDSIYLLVAREEESEVLYEMIEKKGYALSPEDRGLRESLVGTPTAIESLREMLLQSKEHHSNKVKAVIAELEDQVDIIMRDLLKIESLLNDPNVTSRQTPPAAAQVTLDDYDKIVAQKERQIEELVACQEGIGSEKLNFSVDTRNVLENRKKVWQLFVEWKAAHDEAHATGVTDLDVVSYKKSVAELYATAIDLNGLQELDVTLYLVEQMEEETRRLPLIEQVCNPHMKGDHWKPIFEAIQRTYVPTATYTVQCLLAWNLAHFAPLVAQQSELATGQAGVEKCVNDLEQQWEERNIVIDTAGVIPMVVNDDRLREHFEDSFLIVKQLMNSEYIQNMHLVLKRWIERLTTAEDCLTQWLVVQQKRGELQLIAGKTPLVDAKELSPIDTGLREIVAKAQQTTSSLRVLTDPKVIGIVQDAAQQLVLVKEAIDYQLNQKRKQNPRLYTIATDMFTLLDTTDIRCMFPVLADMLMADDKHYGGVKSAEGEELRFVKPLSTVDSHGDLLTDIEAAILAAVKQGSADAVRTYNPQKRQEWMFSNVGQAVQLADEVAWARKVENAMKHNTMAKAKRSTEETMTQTIKIAMGQLTAVQRLATASVLILCIHRHEKMETLVHVTALTSLEWRRHMRYYLEASGEIAIYHGHAKIMYGYEYYGCKQRMVQTPMLDRAYLQFSMAFHSRTCPYVVGPSETGKTELVVDYAYAVGRQMITVNCVADTDASVLVRTILRVAQSGSWLFIDDLSGLEASSVTIVSHLVSNLIHAVQQDKSVLTYRGNNIPVRPGFAVFLSQCLPRPGTHLALSQKIKDQMRTVCLSPPCVDGVIKALAMCAGFPMAAELAAKLKEVFTFFESIPLTHEDAKYRFGMRGIRAVLRGAAAIREADPLLNADSAVVQMLRQMYTVESGGSSDVTELVDSIIRATFPQAIPGTLFPTAISDKIVSMGYVAHKAIVEQVSKTRLLLGNGSHLVLFGDALTGKSTCLKVVAEMSYYTIHNIVAGAYTVAELFGCLHKKTRMWEGGILTHIFGSFSSGGLVVMDGWSPGVMSVLQPVLDGQRSFKLGGSGELVQFPTATSIVLETDTLADADPGVVTRLAMVCSSGQGLGPEHILKSFLQPLRREETDEPINRFAAWKICCDCHQAVAIVKIMTSALEEKPSARRHPIEFAMLLFQAISWGLVVHSGKDRLAHRKSLESLWHILLPSMHVPQDFYTVEPNVETREWLPWRLRDAYVLYDSLQAVEQDSTTVAALSMSLMLLKRGHSVLLNGPAGCGKSTVLYQINNIMKADYVRITPRSMPATAFPHLKGTGLTLCVEDMHLSQSLSTYEWLRQLIFDGRYFKTGDKVTEIKVDIAFAAELNRSLAPHGTDRLFKSCFQFCFPDLAERDRAQDVLTMLLRNSIRLSPASERLIQGLENLVAVANDMLVDSMTCLLPRNPNHHYVFHFGTIASAVAGFRENIERTIKLDDMYSLWYSELSRVFVDRCTSVRDREWARVALQEHAVAHMKQVPNLQDYGTDGVVNVADLPKPLVENMPAVHLDEALLKRVLRVARVLRMPAKTLLLQGAVGSGRRTLIAVAARFGDIPVVHHMTRQGLVSLRDVQEAIISAATGTDTLIVLDYDHLSTDVDEAQHLGLEVAVHSILSLLHGNLLPHLFTSDFFAELARLQAGRRAEKSLGIREAIKRGCHTKLHVVILVTPAGLPGLKKLAPPLMSSAQHFFVSDPDKEQLEALATEMMQQGADPTKAVHASIYDRVPQIAQQCGDLQVFAAKFAAAHPDVKAAQFTMHHFTRLVEAMGAQNFERRASLRIEKLEKGVDIILMLKKQRDEGTSKLDSLVPNLEELADQNDIKYKIVEKDTHAIEEAHQTLARHEQTLDSATRASVDISDVIEQRLGEVLPTYQSALDGVRGITKKDIDEILFIRAPSTKILLVMEAMLSIFGVPLGWDYSKKFLVDSPHQRLETFNIEKNYTKVIDHAKRYVENPDFLPGIIRIINPTTAVFCQWVRAAYAVAEVFKELEPLQSELNMLKDKIEESQANVEGTSKLLEQLELTLLQSEQAYKQAAKDYLNAQDQRFKFECTVERATVFVDNLHDKVDKWGAELDRVRRLVSSPGYFVFHTAACIYCPPLPPLLRDEFLTKLRVHLDIPAEEAWVPEVDIVPAQSFKDWANLGLPDDAHCFQSAFFATTTSNIPLLVDPHQIASVWLKGVFSGLLEATTEDVDVLYDAARNGLPIVVYDFKGLTPELAFYIDPSADIASSKVISAAEGFKLILCAAEPFYHPRVENIDFSVLSGAGRALGVGLTRLNNPKLYSELVSKSVSVASFTSNLHNLDSTLLDVFHELQGSVSEHPTLATDIRANITTAKFEQNELTEATEVLADLLQQVAKETQQCPPEACLLFIDLAEQFRNTRRGMFYYSLRSFLDFVHGRTDFQLLVCSGLPRRHRLALWLQCEIVKGMSGQELSEEEAQFMRTAPAEEGTWDGQLESLVPLCRTRLPGESKLLKELWDAVAETTMNVTSPLGSTMLFSPGVGAERKKSALLWEPTTPLTGTATQQTDANRRETVRWVLQHPNLSLWAKLVASAGISMDAVYDALEHLWDPLRNFHQLPMLENAPVNLPVLIPLDEGTVDPVTVVQYAASQAGLPEELCVVTAHEQPFKEVYPKFQAALHLGSWVLLVDAEQSPAIVARLCAELRMSPMEGSRFRLFVHCPIDQLPLEVIGDAIKLYIDRPHSVAGSLRMATYPLLPRRLGVGIQRPKLLHRIAALHALLTRFGQIGYWSHTHMVCLTAMTELVTDPNAIPIGDFTAMCSLAYGFLEPCEYKRRMLANTVRLVLDSSEAVHDTESADAYVTTSGLAVPDAVPSAMRLIDAVARESPRGGGGGVQDLPDSIGNTIVQENMHADCVTRLANGQISPLTGVLYNELAILNRHIVLVNAELSAWHRGEGRDDVCDAIRSGRVPRRWHALTNAPDAPVASWLRCCRLYVRWFNEWVVEGPPPVYWLPAFNSPAGLFAAVRFTSAFELDVAMTDVHLRCAWTSHMDGDLVDYMPTEGMYVWGMVCEHGTYDRHDQRVVPTRNAHCDLPVVHIRYAKDAPEEQQEVYPVYATAESATALPTLPSVSFDCADADDGVTAAGTRFVIRVWRTSGGSS